MSKNTNNNEIRSALNLNEEEMFMLDCQEEWEAGQAEVDEAAARKILDALLLEKDNDENNSQFDDESPRLYNGIDWDKFAHLVEVQLYMRRVMERIEWIDARLAQAKAGDYLPRDAWDNFVSEKKNLWTKWNTCKALSQSIVGEEKRLWGIFFNLENPQEFLENHLSMDVSVWNTYGRDDEEDEGFDKYHLDVVDMLAQSHIAEMREYDKNESSGKGFWNRGNQRRIENESLNEQSLFAACPF